MRINISPRLRPNRSVIIFIALFVTTLLATHITQRFVFPTTSEYRKMIEEADFVVICAHLGSSPDGSEDYFTVRDTAELGALAEAFQIEGLWLPMDFLIAGAYRLRVHSNGMHRDIQLRESRRVREGRWLAPIDPAVFAQIRLLAERHGVPLRDWSELRNIRRALDGVPPVVSERD